MTNVIKRHNERVEQKALENCKIVADENTAYDEVIRDINSLNHTFVENIEARKLITQKLKQLLRILNDDPAQIE